MKPIQVTRNFQAVPTPNIKKMEAEREDPFSFKDFSTPNMTEKEVEPPSYLWDKIAKVLDEQDRVKNLAVASNSVDNLKKPTDSRVALFAAIVMLIGVVAMSLI